MPKEATWRGSPISQARSSFAGDAETGKKRSRSFRYVSAPETVGATETTPEQVRRLAESFAAEMQQKERRSSRALQRMLERNPELTVEPLFGTGFGEPENLFETYARSVIESDRDLRESSRGKS